MTGFITAYGEDFLLDLICRRAVAPQALYLALVTKPATKHSSGFDIAEPQVAEYVRTRLENGPGTWEQRGGEMAYAQAVPLPFYFTEAWPTVVGWALCDEARGGKVLWAGAMAPATPQRGGSITVPAGGLVIRTMGYGSGVSR